MLRGPLDCLARLPALLLCATRRLLLRSKEVLFLSRPSSRTLRCYFYFLLYHFISAVHFLHNLPYLHILIGLRFVMRY